MSVMATDPHPGVRHLMINRPSKKNALDAATYTALTAGVQSADADESIRAIVLSGAGGTFTSGNDLDDFLGTIDAAPVIGLLRALVTCETPIVAAVEGHAIGIGTTILLHCDLAIAARSAVFALPFVALGLSPEAGSSYLLPKIAGSKLASELLLLGGRFSVDVADRAGLLNRVVDDGEALSIALELAVQLAELPGEALRASRRLLHRDRDHVLAIIDEEAGVFLERLASPEARRIVESIKNRSR